MEELDLVRMDLENGHRVQLSSNFTKVGTILTALLIIPIAIFLGMLTLNSLELSLMKSLIVGFFLILIVCFSMFQLIYAATAELEGKKLHLKKVIGKRYEIDVNQVEKVSMYSSKNTKYTVIRFKAADGNLEKALILNSKSALFGVEVPAGEIIQMAQQM